MSTHAQCRAADCTCRESCWRWWLHLNDPADKETQTYVIPAVTGPQCEAWMPLTRRAQRAAEATPAAR